MSEQVRFKIEGCKVNPDLASICITFVKDENGEYVRYEDYARLHMQFANSEQENARLRKLFADTERLMLLDGEYEAVKVGTYARLKAEVEAQAKRWAESEDLISHYKQQMNEVINDCQCSRLQAEVERLRKAGDELAKRTERLAFLLNNAYLDKERLSKAGDWMREALEEGPIDYQCRIDRWNAAKEGKPTIGLLSPREHWELSNGKSVGSDDTWESYCQRMHADIARWVHAAKEGKPSV